MKILAYRNKQDQLFESILKCIAKTDHTVGFASGEIKKAELDNYSPDIIIHNIDDTEKFPIENNAICVGINEFESKNCFSLYNSKSDNFLKPFVNINTYSKDDVDQTKYSSDVLYIGSPTIFGNKLLKYLTDSKLKFKFFSTTPHNINGYCGICSFDDYFKFYSSAKVSLVGENDLYRKMDIVISDGNPVIFNENNEDECIEKIEQAVNNNKKYTVTEMTKEEIINNHTAFDRAAQIFNTIGLKKVAEKILKQKNGSWKK